MNQKYYQPIRYRIEQYKRLVSDDQLAEEVYKWEFVNNNFGRPDLSVSDFENEIREITRTNLLYKLSSATLMHMAKAVPDSLKELLSNLFDEAKDLDERVKGYIQGSEKLYDSIKGKPSDSSFQDERVIGLFLTLRNPEKYTFFKDSFYKKLCDELGEKPRSNRKKLSHYYVLVEDLIENVITQDKELIELVQSVLPKGVYPDPNYRLLAQDILYQTFDGSAANEPNPENQRIWLYAPGDNASKWNEFYESGIAAIGWDYLGDLSVYSTREEILDRMRQKTGKNRTNDSLACWQFVHVMKPGDIIIAKKGRKEYIGYGFVKSGYYFDELGGYPNQRKVEWKKKGQWVEDWKIVLKVLTDITKYPKYVNDLSNMMGFTLDYKGDVPVRTFNEDTEEISYWWINANPKYWDLSSHPLGSLQTYTTHTQMGGKRRIYKYFQKVRPGDLIIGYETTPKKRVVARLVVTRGIFLDEEDQESIEFRVEAFYPRQPVWEELQQDESLVDAEVFSNNQGSLFRLSQDEYMRIEQLALGKHISREPYNLSSAAEKNLLDESWLKDTIDIWKAKKNLVLQGPPGTGKSFVAERLAWLLMGQKDPSRLHMVQFHPSYSYEDFIEGYRPDGNAGFELQPGHFLKFCRKAETEPESPFVFIIDEINRGNLGKVFGEVMMGIEADKRGKPIHLQYSRDGAFALPSNVYLIGTMNTADRSLAVVDYALRRRFVFKNLVPEFGDRFRSFLKNLNVGDSDISRIQVMMRDVNKLIRDDHSLGIGFTIGHSYFCIPPSDGGSHKKWLNNVLFYEILPLLEEYWFDQPEQLSKAKNILGM